MRKIHQISYTLCSNIIATVISLVITLIVPKHLGISDYSLFQLYLFYFSYVGFFHLGWADGFFLRCGGKYYNELKKNRLKKEFQSFAILQIVIGVGIVLIAILVDVAMEKKYIYIAIGIVTVFYNVRTLFQYLFQATGRIKEYSVTVIIEKVSYFFIVLILLMLGTDRYYLYVVASIAGVLLSLIYSILRCPDLIQTKACAYATVKKEICGDLKSGSNLLLANIAGLLIIGIVRQAIEIKWDVEQFGKLSLSISISNMLVMLINAVAVVLFPMLKRMQNSKIVPLYISLDMIISTLLYGMMAFYYPAKVILAYWLPQYAESLQYLAILFPMCVFECEVSLLTNTYLKVLRKERTIMYINLLSVGLSVALSFISVFVIKNIEVAVFALLILSAFRCIISQIMTGRYLNINVGARIFCEIIMVTVFVVSHYVIQGFAGMTIYCGVVLLYIIKFKGDIWGSLNSLKNV